MAERRMMRRELRAANPSVRAEWELAMMIRKQKVKTFLGWGTASVIGGELAGMGPVSLLVGIMVGGTAAFFSEEISSFAQDWMPHQLMRGPLPLPRQTVVEATTDEVPQDEQEQDELDEPENEEMEDQQEEDDIYRVATANETGGVARLTVDDIVAHVLPNSYKVFIGRSMTKPKYPAVQIGIYKQHFRFMGASQKGKSSMVAAFLDIVTRTHDYKHVRIALLDKEDQTSNLFGHLPHVATIRKDGERVRLHARNDDQVLEYLIYVVEIMNDRYTLSKRQVLELPILLVYIEEFLDLKNTFKSRINQAKGSEAKEQAKSDYATLVYCIEVLSQRGLKARVQLLLCAQVEYADDDFKEAMVNIGSGFSFCVRPTAAAAAGFKNNELLQRNAKENKVGQAVVETPDCNDLVLAPDYDLEQRLLAFERDYPTQPVTDEVTKHEDSFVARQLRIVSRNVPTVPAGGNAQESDEMSANSVGTFRRSDEDKTACEEDGTPQNGVGTSEVLPPGWTEEKLKTFPGFYRALGHLDKALAAIDVSQSQRNRDFARIVLKQQGLWKDAR